MTITVYPTKPSALNMKHPHGPQMAIGGVLWPKDSFTGRRLTDCSVTENKAKAYVPETEKPETPAASEPGNETATVATPPAG